MQRTALVFCVLALSACAGSSSNSQQALPPATLDATSSRTAESVLQNLAARNWSVQTGASTDSYAIQDLAFYPKSITIDAGDSITYTVASGTGGDAHTVAFVPAGQKVPPPTDPTDLVPAGGTSVDGTKFVNSGILVGGQKFTLTFTKAGTYKILCLFHEPAMASTVVVQRAGSYYPHDATYYSQIGIHDEWASFSAAATSVASFPFHVGGTIFAAGIAPGLVHFPPPDSTVLRYLNTNDRTKLQTSGNITIKAGTILTWVNETSNEPHTITFALAGDKDVPAIPPDPAQNVAKPPAITSYDGSKIVNSGTIGPGQKFRLRFTKAGTYYYGCVYHDNSRMTGRVIVVP